MYLIGNKGVGIAVNREIGMAYIAHQLPELNDRQVEMVADYIRGLKAADVFLNK